MRSILGHSVLLLVSLAACNLKIPEGPDYGDLAARKGQEADEGSAGADPSAGGAEQGTPGGGGGGGGGAASGPRDAHVSFRLVDAPADVSAVVVTFDRLEAQLEDGGWKTLAEGEKTVDLLTLQGGAFLDLGVASLPPGRVGQLRLRLVDGGDQHVTVGGVDHALDVPSGAQSGIKIVGGFDVPACASGEVTIDFDAQKSLQVHAAGKSGTYKLRPVVKIKAVVLRGSCEEADGGAEPPPAAPDPCAEVVCADGELCENGACRAAEPPAAPEP